MQALVHLSRLYRGGCDGRNHYLHQKCLSCPENRRSRRSEPNRDRKPLVQAEKVTGRRPVTRKTTPVIMSSNSIRLGDRWTSVSDRIVPGHESRLDKPKSRRKRAVTGVTGGFSRILGKLLGYGLLGV